MNNIIWLGLALLTVFVSGLIGHFFAPFGIILIPIVLIVTTSIVCLKTKNIGSVYWSIFTYLFIALNDIALKLYAGGKHDNEGLGWISIMLLLGLLLTILILAYSILQRKDEKLIVKLLSIFLFIVLIAIHWQLFADLGIGRYYWYKWNGS